MVHLGGKHGSPCPCCGRGNLTLLRQGQTLLLRWWSLSTWSLKGPASSYNLEYNETLVMSPDRSFLLLEIKTSKPAESRAVGKGSTKSSSGLTAGNGKQRYHPLSLYLQQAIPSLWQTSFI